MNKVKTNIFFKIGLLALLAIAIVACVEEIENESYTYEKLMVVDANLSDQTKAHEIRLFFTSPVGGDLDDADNAVTGASVWVEDDQGNATYFTEEEAGYYVSPDDFAGQVGRSYALFIVNSEGKQYRSTFEEMVASPEISQIYNQFSIQATGQGGETEAGVQFFVDVLNANQGSQFYRYEWTDTHQIIVPYPKKWEAIRNNNGLFTILEVDRDLSECYRESTFSELILSTSTNNSNGQLREVPIKFSGARSFDITTMYSIEVTQRSISPEAYSYYRKIELFNESNGTLFDKQQGMIIGNMISVDDPNEEVLGYFEVSGSSSKRVFYTLDQLDEEVQAYLIKPCETNPPMGFEGDVDSFYEAVDVDPGLRGSEISKRSLYELFDVVEGTPEKKFGFRICVDCTRRGSLGKPPYWP